MSLVERQAAIRHDYFQYIDSPMKAYLLGLLASDGCVQADSYRISIELHVKDMEILELFREELAPLHEIKFRSNRPAALIGINSRRIKNDLIKLGVTPRKSLTLLYPHIPAELDNSFILGYFDGDGSLSYSKSNRYQWKLACGSHPFLVSAQRQIFNGTSVKVGGPYRENTIWTLATNWGKVAPVDAWLHADVPGLTRKRLPV